MAAGFHTRKVRVEQSIGDRLKRARTRRKISVAQVEEDTKIRAKFILALESDSWEQVPCEAYGRGYLEAYARYLKLPVEEFMKQYDRSRPAYARAANQGPIDLVPTATVHRPRFLITPRFFMYGAFVVAGLVFTGVISYQVQRFAAAPYLELVAPAQAKTIGTSQLEVYADSFTVNGRTAVGATVKINGQPVVVLSDGSFTESVPVQKGVNAIVVEAVSTTGKKSEEVLTVVVK